MPRNVLVLAAIAALLAGCAPEGSPSMSDVYVYGLLNARLTYFYGAPAEITYEGKTITLTEPTGSERILAAPYAVRGASFVDGAAYLRSAVTPLDEPPVTVSRIPFTTDLQVVSSTLVGEVVYFDGQRYLSLADEVASGVEQRVVPRPRLNRLRGIGLLTNGEADALADAFEASGRPFVVTEMPAGRLPTRSVDGLAEHRRTGVYVQTEIVTDETAYRPAPEQLPWEVLARGGQAVGFDGPTYQLVGNRDQLIGLWSRLHGRQLQVPPLPDVDFRRETIVALMAGEKATGGYGIEVRRVREEDGELYLEVVFTEPAPDALTTQALTSPWVIVRVLRGGYAVAWLRDAEDGSLIGAARATY